MAPSSIRVLGALLALFVSPVHPLSLGWLARDRPAQIQQPSCYVERREPRCLVFVDWHIPKTGGSTMRAILEQLQKAGSCTYWGYKQYPKVWPRGVQRLHAEINATQAIGAPPPRLRLCVEAHGTYNYNTDLYSRKAALMNGGNAGKPDPWTRMSTLHGSILALRATACRPVLAVRIRTPLNFYRSYFFWRVFGLQAFDFADWARHTRNFQTRALYFDVGGRNTSKVVSRNPEINQYHFETISRYLHSFDLVWPVERFQDGLRMLSDITGLDFSSHTTEHVTPIVRGWRLVQESQHRVPDCGKNADTCSAIIRRVRQPCGAALDCDALMREVAPWDLRIYERFSAHFDERFALFEKNGGKVVDARRPPPGTPTRDTSSPGTERTPEGCEAGSPPTATPAALIDQLACVKVHVWVNATFAKALPRAESWEEWPDEAGCEQLLDSRRNPCNPLPASLSHIVTLGMMKVGGRLHMCPPYCSAWVPLSATTKRDTASPAELQAREGRLRVARMRPVGLQPVSALTHDSLRALVQKCTIPGTWPLTPNALEELQAGRGGRSVFGGGSS